MQAIFPCLEMKKPLLKNSGFRVSANQKEMRSEATEL